jgi:DNA-directed RNA polymerase specialized sigma24 family protein
MDLIHDLAEGLLAMSATGSVTHWIGLLKGGQYAAAQPLWERYSRRLVGLARKCLRLRDAPRRAADEEDVALSAFDSFCRRAASGRFPALRDRDNLWKLLVVVTARKALRLARDEGRLKKGGGKVLVEADLAVAAGSDDDQALLQVVGWEPTPEFAAQAAEECRRLLGRLPDETLRSIALWKMEGYTTEEIATRLGCVPRTVERRLRVIRSLWDQEDMP